MFQKFKIIYFFVFSLAVIFFIGLFVKYNIMHSPPVVKISKIDVPSHVELKSDLTIKSKCEVFPPWVNIDIKYDTDNHNIATVDGKTLKPVAEGMVKIIAFYNGKEMANCNIQIRDTKVVDINIGSSEYTENGFISPILAFSSVSISPVAVMNYPTGAPPEVTYYIEDTDVAGIEGYEVVGYKTGTTNLIAKAGDFEKVVPVIVRLQP